MKTSGIDRLLSKMGIKAPNVATMRDMAPILMADYEVRGFAREAAQRISQRFGLDEDTVFWMIVDETPEQHDLDESPKEWMGVLLECNEFPIGKVRRPGWGCPICGWKIGMLDKPKKCDRCGFKEK